LLFKRIDGWYGVVLLDTECLISIHTRTFRGNSKECDYRTKRERERNTRTDVAIGNRPISSSGIKRVERRKTQTYRRKPCACPLSSCSALLCWEQSLHTRALCLRRLALLCVSPSSLAVPWAAQLSFLYVLQETGEEDCPCPPWNIPQRPEID
jgi:hypothetical protein